MIEMCRWALQRFLNIITHNAIMDKHNSVLDIHYVYDIHN